MSDLVLNALRRNLAISDQAGTEERSKNLQSQISKLERAAKKAEKAEPVEAPKEK